MESISATWLNFRPTSWVFEFFFAVLCGVGLFLLILPYLQSHPPSPQSSKQRSIRRCQTEPRGRKNKKKSGGVKACRMYLRELQGAQSLLSLLESKLGKSQKKSSSPQGNLGKVCKAEPDEIHQPCEEEHVNTEVPAKSLSTKSPPQIRHPPPLASSPGPVTSPVSDSSYSPPSGSQLPQPLLPVEVCSPPPPVLSPPPLNLAVSGTHPPGPLTSSIPPLPDSALPLPQCDSSAVPLNAVTQRSSPNPLWSAAANPAISSFRHSSGPNPGLSRLQAAAKALCLSTLPHCESQQGHLSHSPPVTSLWGDPTKRQVEADDLSSLNSYDRELLEIQVTKRVEIKIWNETENGSYPRRLSSDYHLNPLGSVLRSVGAEQDSTAPQTFWSLKDKPEHLPKPQQLSYPNVLGDHLQQKYNQLFWGLPSLHSESLVATAWISENSSALQSPTFLFNGIASACPVQMQTKISSLLSQSPPPSHLEFQSQPLVPTKPQFQSPALAQVLTQKDLQSSAPALPPSSPPYASGCGVSCPTAQNMRRPLSPTEIEHPEWPLLQKQVSSERDLSPVVKSSQEVFNVFSPSPSVDNWVVSILPDNFPISPELRKQLEHHLQSWLIQHQWELPRKIQESLELKQFQGHFPRTRHVKKAYRFSHPYAYAGEHSNSPQRTGLQLARNMGHLGDILGKVPKDFSRCSGNALLKAWGVNSDESDSDAGMSSSNSGNDLLKRLDKNLDHILKIHLSRKLGRVSECLMPTNNPQSSLVVSQGHHQAKKKNLGIVKGWDPPVNTSHRIPFLDSHIQELLEAHVVKFWVKHRWSLPLKVLKSVNLFKMVKTRPSPYSQFCISPTVNTVQRGQSRVKFAQFQEESPLVQEPAPTFEKTLVASTPPVCEEIQVCRQPSPPFTNSQNNQMEWTKRESPESSSTSATGRSELSEPTPTLATGKSELGMSYNINSQTSQDACHVVKSQLNLGSQMRTNEGRNVLDVNDSSSFQSQITTSWEPSMMSIPQTGNVPLRILESLGSTQSPLLSPMPAPQSPIKPSHNNEFISELKARVEAKSKSQPQDFHTYDLFASNNMTSWVPECYHQMSDGDRVTAPKFCDSITDQKARWLGQQEPAMLKFQDSLKRQNKMADAVCEREEYRKFNPREHSGFKKWPAFQVGYQNYPVSIREPDKSQESRYLKKQAPSENIFKKKIRLFFQWVFSSKKGRDQEPLIKGKNVVATCHHQGPDKCRSVMNGETAEAQALMTAVGQILEEKMALNQGPQGPKLKEQRQEFPGSACRCFHYHRPVFHPEQGRMTYTPCNHHPNSKIQNQSTRESQMRQRNSLKIVRFNDENLGLKCSPTLSPKKTLSPIGPIKLESKMPAIPNHHHHQHHHHHHHHCPRHCLHQGSIFPGKS